MWGPGVFACQRLNFAGPVSRGLSKVYVPENPTAPPGPPMSLLDPPAASVISIEKSVLVSADTARLAAWTTAPAPIWATALEIESISRFSEAPEAPRSTVLFTVASRSNEPPTFISPSTMISALTSIASGLTAPTEFLSAIAVRVTFPPVSIRALLPIKMLSAIKVRSALIRSIFESMVMLSLPPSALMMSAAVGLLNSSFSPPPPGSITLSKGSVPSVLLS